MYGFTIKIKFAKVLSSPFLKESLAIYKVFVYLSSPANQSVQLLVKHKLEIEGV